MDFVFIEDGNDDHQKLPDLVWLSRIISAAANSKDEGILTERWNGEYGYGKSPVTWNGSVKIIQQYAESGVQVRTVRVRNC